MAKKKAKPTIGVCEHREPATGRDSHARPRCSAWEGVARDCGGLDDVAWVCVAR